MSIETLTSSILSKMPGMNKWRSSFFLDLVHLWIRLRGRYNFENLARQSSLNVFTFRTNFGKNFDFQYFNQLLYSYLGQELLMVFDPCFITKSGKHTAGLGYFWSGCAGAIRRGLEMGGFACVDVLHHSAFHYYAQQTLLQEGESLLSYYARLVQEQATKIRAVSRYLVVDAYFAKYNFIQAVCQVDLELVTRLRDDAVLRYPYLGTRTKQRGRPQQYAAKLDPKNPDLTYFRPCIQEQDWVAYEAVLQAKALKRWVKVVLVHEFDETKKLKNYKIFISTDTTMTGIDLFLYYHLRFQIEFLYRDAKQFMGLNHCQSRKKQRLHFHFNFVLTLLSLMKIVHWLPKIKEKQEKLPFSVQNIKNEAQNEFLLERFSNAFGISPQTPNYINKIKELKEFAKINP